MDEDERQERCLHHVFRSFVCMALMMLLGLHGYGYFWGPKESFDGDFSDVKYVVMQLTHDLSEVNRKHEELQNEMEKISAVLPPVGSAGMRLKDENEPAVRRSSRQALDIHVYDRQVVDYALESAGARIIDTGETLDHVLYESPVGWALHLLSSIVAKNVASLNAQIMLRPNSLPGECWAFKGSKGEATIRLLGTIYVTGISIEHISPDISPTREISSAPRKIQLEGLKFRFDQYPQQFGVFEYDKEGPPIQYFEVQQPSPKSYNVVRIRVLSNWGHPEYTCVYRVRIHGELAPGQMPKSIANDDEL